MDEAEHATNVANQLHEIHIAAVRRAANYRPLQPVGACHWCGERFITKGERIFCDNFCAEDHERQRRQQRGRR